MEQRDEILRLRLMGLSYVQIGQRLGLAREQVREIIKDARSKIAPDSKLMLTPGDVALLLGIHVNTVRRWSEKRVLKPYRISARGGRRYRREDIDRFLKERQIRGGS